MLFFRCCSTGDLFLPFLLELNSLRIPWAPDQARALSSADGEGDQGEQR
jgi:hypothetical protein